MHTNKSILRTFGVVWAASGAQGTFGEGYKDHWLRRLGGMCFWFVTFVAKTVTTNKNIGNTPLEADGFRPKEFIPRTVFITFWLWLQASCLNCFGLSNDGIESALKTGKWQKREKPFMLSFMPIGDKSTWLEQAGKFVEKVRVDLLDFLAEIALQFNASCPNTGIDPKLLAPFLVKILEVLRALGIPIFVKINAEFPIPLAKVISEHPSCSGLIMGNTMPFGGKLPTDWPQVPWIKLFGTDEPSESPLAHRFGGDPGKAGGYSGKHLLPIVCRWIKEAREVGITCHINAGGGILNPWGAWKAWRAGADSISLGMISGFRPLMMLPTTLTAQMLFRMFPRT